MLLNLTSSAPHIWPVSEWDHRASQKPGPHDFLAQTQDFVLHTQSSPMFEIGIHKWNVGSFPQHFPFDELRYFFSGRGTFRSTEGESIEVGPETAVHFKTGWGGTLDVEDPLHATYVSCEGGASDRTPVLRDVLRTGPLKEWGPVSKPLESVSQTAGILLSREADRRAESGIWTCTPGLWRCELKSDEFCHFLAGSSTYTHDNGEIIEVRPDTLACFPKGWKGQCRVHETVRKVYIIR